MMRSLFVVLCFASVLLLLFRDTTASQDYGSFLSQLQALTAEDIPFRSPVIHPFHSKEELEFESQRDPFVSFSARDYLTSVSRVKHLADVVVKQTSSKRAINQAKMELSSLLHEHYPVKKNINLLDPTTNSKLVFHSDAKVLAGTVSLANEASISDVKCQDESIVDIRVSDTTRIAQWIPGTRMIIPSNWKCGSEQAENESAVFRLIIRREVKERGNTSSPTLIRFHTQKLQLHDLIVNSKVTLQYDPPVDKISPLTPRPPQNVMTSFVSGTNNTWHSLFSTSQHAPGPHKRLIPYSGSFKKMISLASFNYDDDTYGPKEANMTLWSGTSDSYSYNVYCASCFAHLSVGVRFELETGWLSIDRIRVLVGGVIEYQYTLGGKLDINWSSTKRADMLKDIFLGQVIFSIGFIPVDITFHFDFSIEVTAQLEAAIHISQHGSFRRELWTGFEYSGGSLRRVDDSKYGFPHFERPSLFAKGSAEVRLTMIPTLKINLWGSLHSEATIVPYSGLNIDFSSGNSCPTSDVHYQFYWGVDAYVKVTRFRLPSFLGGSDLSNSVSLPWESRVFALVSKTPMRCSFCSGCVLNTIRSITFDDRVLDMPYKVTPISTIASLEITLGLISGSLDNYLYIPGMDPDDIQTETLSCTIGCTFRSIVLKNINPKEKIKIHHMIDKTLATDPVVATYDVSFDIISSIGNFIFTQDQLRVELKNYPSLLTTLEPTKLPSGNIGLQSRRCHYYYHANPNRDQLSIGFEEKTPNTLLISYSNTQSSLFFVDSVIWENTGLTVQSNNSIYLSVCSMVDAPTSYQFSFVYLKAEGDIASPIQRTMDGRDSRLVTRFSADGNLYIPNRVVMRLNTHVGEVDAYCVLVGITANLEEEILDYVPILSQQQQQTANLKLVISDRHWYYTAVAHVVSRSNVSRFTLSLEIYSRVEMGSVVPLQYAMPNLTSLFEIDLSDEDPSIVYDYYVEITKILGDASYLVCGMTEDQDWSKEIRATGDFVERHKLNVPGQEFLILIRNAMFLKVFSLIKLYPGISSYHNIGFPPSLDLITMEKTFVALHSRHDIERLHFKIVAYESVDIKCEQCYFDVSFRLVELPEYRIVQDIRVLSNVSNVVETTIELGNLETNGIALSTILENFNVEVIVRPVSTTPFTVRIFFSQSLVVQQLAKQQGVIEQNQVLHYYIPKHLIQNYRGVVVEVLSLEGVNGNIDLIVGQPGLIPYQAAPSTILVDSSGSGNYTALARMFDSPTQTRNLRFQPDNYYLSVSAARNTKYLMNIRELLPGSITVQIRGNKLNESSVVVANGGLEVTLLIEQGDQKWNTELVVPSERGSLLAQELLGQLKSSKDYANGWNKQVLPKLTSLLRNVTMMNQVIFLSSPFELVIRIPAIKEYKLSVEETEIITLAKVDPMFFSTGETSMEVKGSFSLFTPPSVDTSASTINFAVRGQRYNIVIVLLALFAYVVLQ